MKEFLKMTLIEPFTEGWWLGWVTGILMWLLLIFIASMAIWGIMWLIDSTFLPLKEGSGVIVNKYVIPAHTQTSFVLVGKVTVPMTTYYNDSYVLSITVDGLCDEVEVSKSYWDRAELYSKLKCTYANGRILNSLYIKSF